MDSLDSIEHHPIELGLGIPYVFEGYRIKVWVPTNKSRKVIFETNDWMTLCMAHSHQPAMLESSARFDGSHAMLKLRIFSFRKWNARASRINNEFAREQLCATHAQHDAGTPERRQYAQSSGVVFGDIVFTINTAVSARKLIKFPNSKLKSCLMQSFFVSIKL